MPGWISIAPAMAMTNRFTQPIRPPKYPTAKVPRKNTPTNAGNAAYKISNSVPESNRLSL